MLRYDIATAARRRKLRSLLRIAILGPILVVSMVALTGAAILAFRELPQPDDQQTALALLFALIAAGSFVSSASIALQSLYLSTDVPYLLSLPIPVGFVYGEKFLAAMIGTGPGALVLVATLVAYLSVAGATWGAVATAIAIGFGLLSIVTSTAILLVALIARSIPVKRARRFLGTVALVIMVLVLAVWTLLMPDTSSAGASGLEGRLAQTIGSARDVVDATPFDWGAAVIVGTERGGLPWSDVARFAAIVAGLWWLAFAVFVRTFTTGHARLRAATTAPPRLGLARCSAQIVRPFPQELGALVQKEWLTMSRDLRRLSGAVWPLGMVVFYAVALSRDDSGVPVDTPGLRFWLNAGSVALLPWGASLGISIYAFGSERRNIELLRALPIPPRTLLLAKTLASLLPVLALATVATAIVCLAQRATLGQAAGLWGIVAWATVGYVTIDTASSVLGPNFAAAHVQRSTTVLGRLVGFATGTVFTLATATAAARLVLFSTGIPRSFEVAVGRDIGAITTLGWPLVATSAGIAAFTVVALVVAADRRLTGILRGAR